MKPVRGLSAEPAGLRRYRVDHPDGTWDEYKDHDDGTAVAELKAALTLAQRGLCCYCEGRLPPEPEAGERLVQVEHFQPKSVAIPGTNVHLHPTNLLASCPGRLREPWPHGYEDKRTRRDNIHCDHKKGDTPPEGRIADPRLLHLGERILAVDDLGRMSVDEGECCSVSPELVASTLDELGLDCRLLREHRETVWIELFDETDELEDEEYERYARAWLLPDDQGLLPPYWTTARSSFGPVAEAVIASAGGALP